MARSACPHSPLAYGTPRQCVLSRSVLNSHSFAVLIINMPNRLVSSLVEDALSEVAYDAYLAGFNYNVTNHKRGMQVSVSGYSDKLDVVVGTITRYLREMQVDPRKLDVAKEQVGKEFRRTYRRTYVHWCRPPVHTRTFTWGNPATCPMSSRSGQCWTPFGHRPINYLRYHVRSIPTTQRFCGVYMSTVSALVISVEDVEIHHKELLSKVSIEALVTGNLRSDVGHHAHLTNPTPTKAMYSKPKHSSIL